MSFKELKENGNYFVMMSWRQLGGDQANFTISPTGENLADLVRWNLLLIDKSLFILTRMSLHK